MSTSFRAATLAWVALAVVVGLASQRPAHPGRVLKAEELHYTQLDKLDRNKTVFFLTFGNLEEHGPHLPIGSDLFQASAIRDGVIARLAKQYPDYTFIAFPLLPLGEGGANTIPLKLDFVGTYSVRLSTLRDVAIDLGSAIARQGFRNIFVVHFHGAPLHNEALTDASAFVSQTYKVRMVNLTSLAAAKEFFDSTIMTRHLGADWQQRTGWEGHAGAAETAMNLALRPEFVRDYQSMPTVAAATVSDVYRVSKSPRWRGYWGAPALASERFGRELSEISSIVSFSWPTASLKART